MQISTTFTRKYKNKNNGNYLYNHENFNQSENVASKDHEYIVIVPADFRHSLSCDEIKYRYSEHSTAKEYCYL